MTVTELITKLQTYPAELPVRLWDYDELQEEGTYVEIEDSHLFEAEDDKGETFLRIF